MTTPNFKDLCVELVEAVYAQGQHWEDVLYEVAGRAKAAIDKSNEPLPDGYIDQEHSGLDKKLLEVFYTATRSEGGTTDEIYLRGIKAVIEYAGGDAVALEEFVLSGEESIPLEQVKQNLSLPGFKGQWLLCKDCPPSQVYCDVDGHVQVIGDYPYGFVCKPPCKVDVHEYWSPNPLNDPRPFALTSKQAASLSRGLEQAREREFANPPSEPRLFDTLTGSADGETIWAVADDGTAWEHYKPRDRGWCQLPPLPDREVK